MDKIDNSNSNDEIDLLELIKTLVQNKFFIFKICIFFMFFGFLVAITSPIKFTSSILFFPQNVDSKASSSSSISGLASLAGIDLDQSNFSISPTLYPKILESTSFKRKMLLTTLNDDKLTLKKYLTNKKSGYFSILKSYTIGLPQKIIKLFKQNKNQFNNRDNNIIDQKSYISSEEYGLFLLLDEIINLTSNSKERYIEIVVEFDNPLYSSIITKAAYRILQSKIIEYRIQSSKEQLEFTIKNYNIKKKEFEDIQNELAIFQDENQIISSSIFSNKLFRLQNKFKIIESVFRDLSIKLENSKLQLNKEIPVFIVIKEVSVPNFKSSPNRLQIIFTYSILGLICSVVYVFIKKPLKILIKILYN